MTLLFGDQGPVADDEVKQLLVSIIQDLGRLPEDYLQVSGGYSGYPHTDTDSGPGEAGKAAAGYDLQNPVYYPEWDYTRQRYRNEFCALTEVDVAPVEDNFYTGTLEKYRFHLQSVRRSFETMAEGYEQRKRQTFGDEIDFDALVEASADRRQGLEMSENLYSCFHRSRRDVAVMFMVDMSGSTRGWVNLVEREALVLLCEALEMLSDPYAIYGFSGRTHKRCEIYRVKKFEEACTALVRAPDQRHQTQNLYTYGRSNTPPGKIPAGAEGQVQVADYPVRRQTRGLRRLPGALRHGRHPPGHRGSPRRWCLSLLYHHRQRGERVPALHVRQRQLHGDR